MYINVVVACWLHTDITRHTHSRAVMKYMKVLFVCIQMAH